MERERKNLQGSERKPVMEGRERERETLGWRESGRKPTMEGKRERGRGRKLGMEGEERESLK